RGPAHTEAARDGGVVHGSPKWGGRRAAGRGHDGRPCRGGGEGTGSAGGARGRRPPRGVRRAGADNAEGGPCTASDQNLQRLTHVPRDEVVVAELDVLVAGEVHGALEGAPSPDRIARGTHRSAVELPPLIGPARARAAEGVAVDG